MTGIGQDIKGACRFHGNAETQFSDPFDHVFSAFVINGPHPLNIFMGKLQGGNARPLGNAPRRYEKVLLDLLHGPNEVRGRNQIAQTPTGHGKKFGKPVQHEGILRKFKDGMLFFSVDQAVINLIGYDGWAQLRHFSHSIFGKQVSGGIGRRIDEDRPGFRPDIFLDRFGTKLKPVFFIALYPDGPGPQEFREIGVAGVMGIGHDHLFPGFEEGGEDHEQGRGGARSHQDAIRINADAVFFVVMLADGLPQFQQAQAVGIVGFAP